MRHKGLIVTVVMLALMMAFTVLARPPVDSPEMNGPVVETPTFASHNFYYLASSPPAKEKDILAKVDNPKYFKTFLEAVESADLTEFFQSEEPITVFVPLEKAFAQLSQEELDAILNDTEQLKAFLMSHVVRGEVRTGDLAAMQSVRTADGSELQVEVTADEVRVGGAKVVFANVPAGNGVIHVVNQVVQTTV